MHATSLERRDGLRSFVVVFRTDDDLLGAMRDWIAAERVTSASFTAIGACRSVTLGYFDIVRKDYLRIEVDEQVEVLSLAGNVARGPDGSAKIHAHIVVGTRDGTARGGHLLDARVRPTIELVLTEHPPHLQRRSDPETGLALLEGAGATARGKGMS